MHPNGLTGMSSPKTQILRTLIHSTWVSGQTLAHAAGISRTAIWKHIRALRKEGYAIQASSGRGYRLEYIPDRLSAEGVQAGLQTTILGREIVFRSHIDSTQNLARTLGEQGADEGTVVLADTQSQGRGRRGRSWAAIPGGTAMSVIFRPDLPPDRAPHFPILAGTALGRAIAQTTGHAPGLKWPNDVLISGRKVVGILAELEAEADRINAIYLGIGINVNARLRDIPQDLQTTATSLRIQTGRTIDRLHLVQNVLYELEAAYFTYMAQGFAPIRKAWLEQNITLGHPVRIISGQNIQAGTAKDMDEDGALVLRSQCGDTTRVTAGDVQLCEKTGRGS